MADEEMTAIQSSEILAIPSARCKYPVKPNTMWNTNTDTVLHTQCSTILYFALLPPEQSQIIQKSRYVPRVLRLHHKVKVMQSDISRLGGNFCRRLKY